MAKPLTSRLVPSFSHHNLRLAPVVQKVDNAIHSINLYPENSATGFPDTYPVDRDLSGG